MDDTTGVFREIDILSLFRLIPINIQLCDHYCVH